MSNQTEVHAAEIQEIQRQIRAMVPGVDTVAAGVALPHPKTPQGRTRVLHMNYTRNRANQPVATEQAYLRFFAQTAKKLGIHLEILTCIQSVADVKAELGQNEFNGLDYSLLTSQNPVSKWAEDSVEYLADGRMAVLTPFQDDLLAWAMTEGRRQRWQSLVSPETLADMLAFDERWVPLGIRVNASATGQVRSRLAQAQGQSVGQIRAYIEGGNMITGEDQAGRPIILVGQDAIATTANLYQLEAHQVKQIIQEDFSLETPEQVISVEQPGQFHLDMGLLFIGYGVVVINDSRTALQDALEMAEFAPCETTRTMATKRQLQCQLEAIATQDLLAAGLKVIPQALANDVMYNFFNGEFVEGSDQHQYYITNGGPKDQEDFFAKRMVVDWQVVDHVVFSSPPLAHKSLQERGGVGCRLKGSGTKGWRSPHDSDIQSG
ncbi:MAG: hypothetical protein VKJ64_12885 [Leptolyngbyaceae bacterium]|nr:hypothetical protein [Leptolyngbyaceae bacterium]